MLIYTHPLTNRCRYSFELVFSTLLNLPYTVTDQLDLYLHYKGEKIAYLFERPQGGFFIQAAPILFEKDIRPQAPDMISFEDTSALFPTGGDFPFDLFAASFYLVSRYEEYLPFTPDPDSRFPPTASLAGRHGFLQTPVVNTWAAEFKKRLNQFYPTLCFPAPVFHSVTSIDIDAAYAFAGRSRLYNAAVLGKWILSGRWKDTAERWEVIRERVPDPFDTYAVIRQLLEEYCSTPLFFFLLGHRRTRYDRNLSPASAKLQSLIRETGSYSEIGIHPSYYSMDKPALLLQEKAALEKILGRAVTKSRQHFLRFRLPHTYRHLLQAGITDDYSMGYAGTPGFRAGICTPFYFYDLELDCSTSLKIHPVTYMEATFIQFLHTPPIGALASIRDLVSAVKKVKGTCLSIWHNETVSEVERYRGWRSVFEESLYMNNQL